MPESEVISRYGAIVGLGAGLIGGGLSGNWFVGIGTAIVVWAAMPFVFAFFKR